MGIIGWIVLGLLAGIIAKRIFPGGEGLGIVMTTLLGIGGALLGGLVASVLGLVAERCAVDSAMLGSNSHRPRAVTARALACHVAVVRHGLTATAVAAELGISPRSVTRGLERAQQLATLVPELTDLVR